jgi:hypothetical protein
MPTGPRKLKPEPTALRARRRGRWLAVIAVIAVTAGAERSRHHRRAAGPTGAQARGKWSTRKDRPWSRRRAVGTIGTERPVHAVVVLLLVMPGDCGAGEEHNSHHEDDARHDHHPRRHLVQPRVQCRVRERRCSWRRGWARGRLDRRFGCLRHVLIMPTQGPAINNRARESHAEATELAVLRPEHPGEFQNDHGDERDSRNDRHPGRYLVEPFRIRCRCDDGRRRSGRWRNRRLGCLAHTSHNASGQQRPRPGSGGEVAESPPRHDARRPTAPDPCRAAKLGARRPLGAPGS